MDDLGIGRGLGWDIACFLGFMGVFTTDGWTLATAILCNDVDALFPFVKTFSYFGLITR